MTFGKEKNGCNFINATYCEYSNDLNILIPSNSMRECVNRSSCPKEVFSNPLIYKTCSYYIDYKRNGPPVVNKVTVSKPKVEQQNKQYTPKFTNIQCNGCQYKASSYCWGQCSFNIWKKKSDW